MRKLEEKAIKDRAQTIRDNDKKVFLSTFFEGIGPKKKSYVKKMSSCPQFNRFWRDLTFRKIEKGDTIDGIVEKYRMSVREIMERNPQIKDSLSRLPAESDIYIGPNKKGLSEEYDRLTNNLIASVKSCHPHD